MTIDPAQLRSQAVFLRAHCRLHEVGMRHSTLSPTRLRQSVEQVTARSFRRGDWVSMIASLNQVIERGHQ